MTTILTDWAVRPMPRDLTRATLDLRYEGGRGSASVKFNYAQHLHRRALNEATIQRRLRCLDLLEAECGDLLAVEPEAIDAFLDRRNLSSITRVNWLSHLHSFYRWALAYEYTYRDPTARLTRPKLRRKLPRPIREADYRRALDLSPTATMTAWLLLGGHAGLRCMGIAGLLVDEVDFDARELLVLEKGEKERVVPMHSRVADALKALELPRSGYVFRTTLGRPYTAAQVSHLIGRYLRSVGVDATAHQLRHRFATAVLDETGDIAVVADLCGHESLDTARIYSKVSSRRKRSAVDGLA